jgi:hypothetical protein
MEFPKHCVIERHLAGKAGNSFEYTEGKVSWKVLSIQIR